MQESYTRRPTEKSTYRLKHTSPLKGGLCYENHQGGVPFISLEDTSEYFQFNFTHNYGFLHS